MDILLGIIGVVLAVVLGLFALVFLFCLYLFVGWLVALGLLAYGLPVFAFWAFVGWVACLFVFRLMLS